MIDGTSLTLTDRIGIKIKPSLKKIGYWMNFMDASDPAYSFLIDAENIVNNIPDDFDSVLKKLGDTFPTTKRLQNYVNAIQREVDNGEDLFQLGFRMSQFYTHYYTYKKLYDRNKVVPAKESLSRE